MEDREISDSKHGFTKGKSCSTNLMGFCDRVTASVDKGTASGVIYLDFYKAFEVVSHKPLHPKLERQWMDSLVDEELVGWLHTEGSGQ